jgi:hypothetical protein
MNESGGALSVMPPVGVPVLMNEFGLALATVTRPLVIRVLVVIKLSGSAEGAILGVDNGVLVGSSTVMNDVGFWNSVVPCPFAGVVVVAAPVGVRKDVVAADSLGTSGEAGVDGTIEVV